MTRSSPDISDGAGTTFSEALNRLVPEGELGLAVSGGPDSLALLLLAAEARPGQVRAATVDHGLRPESAEEAAQVARACESVGVPHKILAVTVAPAASLQAQARAARYAALGQWAGEHGLAAVATAHHADDQAETLLMRLARGSGIGGLRGIRESRPLVGAIRLVRPLLSLRKAQLVAIVEQAGWTAIDDPANHDPRHERTRVRALLAANPWLEPERLARSAGALAQADDALDEQLQGLAGEHLRSDGRGAWLCDEDRLPAELARRLLRRALAMCGTEPSGPELDRVLAALAEQRAVTIGGAKVTPTRDGWRVEPAPPRRQSHP